MLIAVPCMHSISFFFTATQFLTLFSSSTILEHFSYVGRWSAEEHQVFILGMQQYPKEWKKIAAMVKTRTVVQIRTHAQKCWNDAMADPRKCKTSDVDTGASALSKTRLVAVQASSNNISPKNNPAATSTRKRKKPPVALDSLEEEALPADTSQMGVGRRRRRPTAKSSALTAAAVAAAMGQHNILPASLRGMHMGRQLFNGVPVVKKEKGSPRQKKKKKSVGRPRSQKVQVGVQDSPAGVMSFHEPMQRHGYHMTLDTHVHEDHQDIDLQLLSCTTDQFITHNDLNHGTMNMMNMAGQYQPQPKESRSPTGSDESVNSTDSNASVGSSDSGWNLTMTGAPAIPNASAQTPLLQLGSSSAQVPLLQLKLQQQTGMQSFSRPSISIPAAPQGQSTDPQKQEQGLQSPQVGSAAYAAKYLKSSMNLNFGSHAGDDVLAPVPQSDLYTPTTANSKPEVDAVSMLNDDLNFFNDLLFT